MEEANALRYYYEDLGFKGADEVGPERLYYGTGSAFVGSQLPLPSTWEDVSKGTREYFTDVVHPVLAHKFETGHPSAIAVAEHVGRITAVNGMISQSVYTPVRIGSDKLMIENFEVPHEGVDGQVIEYGLGLRGMDSHWRDVPQGRYSVYGVVHGDAEAFILNAARDRAGMTEEHMTIESGGIVQRIGAIISAGYRDAADLVIASRTHAAGEELRAGIDMASILLRQGGLLVAVGPCDLRRGYDYAEAPAQIEAHPSMEVVADESFAVDTPYRNDESNRLVVARRI